MKKQLKAKLRSRSGETIAETLIALLISALALVMLAGAVDAAARIIMKSEAKMQAYYQANNDLAEPGEGGTDASISFYNADNKPVKLDPTGSDDGIPVQYKKNDIITAAKPVVAYVTGGD